MAPSTDVSGEVVVFRMLSRSYRDSLDGSTWFRRGKITYPRIPTRSQLGAKGKYTTDVLKKVAPAIPQLRAADVAYIPATTCPLRLAKAYVPVIRAPVTAMEKAGMSKYAGIPGDKDGRA